MPARILDGKWLSKFTLARVTREVESNFRTLNAAPGLGVILVGDDPASKTYVANKSKAATACGFKTFDVHLPASATFDDVRSAILSYNNNPQVHGILLQLPLPKHIDSNKLLDEIDPRKDADGLHPLNQGLLIRGQGVCRPCTPLGAIKLIDLAYADVDTSAVAADSEIKLPPKELTGKNAIVIGRSILVGKPVALLLLERNATVTMAHSKTPDLAAQCKEADIIVAAVGVPRLVRGSWVKPGAIVIDVGINRQSDRKLCGDVHFEEVSEIASAITPVPGGAGPMTIAMLIQNTLNNFKMLSGI